MAILKVTRGLWGSSHPGPTVVVTALTAALAVSAGLGVERILLLALAVFLGQLSVGISNDAFDAERDRAVGRSDKPIARGDLSVRAAWAGAISCLTLALLLSAPLGLGLLGAHLVFLAASWAYNAGLKATVFSLAPFLLAFGLFPSFSTLASPASAFAAPWAWFAGAALGAAIHLTNVLPDLDDDARTGITGLPHRLGARPSAGLAAAAVLAGGVAVTAGSAGWQLDQVPVISWVFLLLVSAVALLALGLAARARSGRVLFRLVMLAALLLAAQLVVAGGSLAG
ncbi:UbiA family prenyltransferase [Nesterenkonia sp. LB17]|uniref:UbiA family prenyltransferase n=1 Tax=Nesterenkonia sp. LB17 TaxID=2901230 RepID=UPI001F4CD8FA|nr:UbiA family prenyltransferase [Nesterenkonia sp. LB17]MCH8566256.1 UbiA family prenyltransferase [Nesterenkonia sp. LB17]